MNIAAQKLVETNLNIVTIAYAVGYNNVSKFSSAFKSVMGELPHI
jgi:AraC-like DNA-binding protein